MFKIGEFSKLTQVTIRMLRYYDEKGLLKPALTDPHTGYRMYSVEQIPVLNKIIYLRDSGFTVSEIAAAIDIEDKEQFEKILDRKSHEIYMSICSQQQQLKKIKLAREELLEGSQTLHYHISLKSIPQYKVLSLRRRIPDYYYEGNLWQELSALVHKYRIPVLPHTFSIYHDEDYRETDVDVELCAEVKDTDFCLKKDLDGLTWKATDPVPLMASTMVCGPFSRIAGAYLEFARWLQKNSGYKMRGPNRQIVHRGPWNESHPEKYLTELQIPLTLTPCQDIYCHHK